MHAIVRRELPVYGRYLIASGLAVGLDLLVFWTLLGAGMDAAAAAAVGYTAGIAAHWLLSSRAVFVGRVYRGGKYRRRQKLGFALSALAGLGITVAVVAIGGRLGADPALAKLIAVAASFNIVFVIRRWAVFA